MIVNILIFCELHKLQSLFYSKIKLNLHLRPRVESITDDNVASNCSITRKYFSKRSVFLKFYFYLCYVYRQILLFVLQH